MSPRLTVCVLLYGEHVELARRCLNQRLRELISLGVELRLGMNACGAATYEFVNQEWLRPGLLLFPNLYASGPNLGKYPMMRRMLHYPSQPVQSPLVMWFDDDSFILPETNVATWLTGIEEQMRQAHMLGPIYICGLQGNQYRFIQDQPWYTGQPVQPRQVVRFATGGWWTIRTDVLYRYNWPIPELHHNGGDVLLGELCRQQGLTLQSYHAGVAFNYDELRGNQEATRRGLSLRPKPLGCDYVPPASSSSLYGNHARLCRPRTVPASTGCSAGGDRTDAQ